MCDDLCDSIASKPKVQVSTTFAYSTWELFRASFAIANRRRIILALYFLWTIFWIVLLSFQADGAIEDSDFTPLLGTICIGIVATPLIVGVYGLRVWFNTRRAMQSPGAKEPRHFLVNDAGVTVTSTIARVHLKWQAIIKVVELRSDFLFYFSDALALSLPKRALEDASKQSALRQLLRAEMGQMAYLRNLI
jgi:hypothetical protein